MSELDRNLHLMAMQLVKSYHPTCTKQIRAKQKYLTSATRAVQSDRGGWLDMFRRGV